MAKRKDDVKMEQVIEQANEAVAEAIKAQTELEAMESVEYEIDTEAVIGAIIGNAIAETKIGKWVIGTQKFKNKEYLYLREFYTDEFGEYRPGKRGVNILLSEFEEIIKALLK